MKEVNKISKLIGKDINDKLIEKGLTRSFIHKEKGICSEPTLLKIIRGEIDNVVPLSKIIEIYKSMGFFEIDLVSDNFELYIRF